MIKKEVTYMDYNGKERTEEYYFNLNKRETLKLAFELPDSEINPENEEQLEKMTNEEIGKKIFDKLGEKGMVEFIEKIILNSYGVKTEDGRGFRKSEELKEAFANSLVFDKIFMEMIEKPEYFAAFLEGVIPSK